MVMFILHSLEAAISEAFEESSVQKQTSQVAKTTIIPSIATFWHLRNDLKVCKRT